MENELLRVALKHAHAIDDIERKIANYWQDREWNVPGRDAEAVLSEIDEILKRLKVKVGSFSINEKVAALKAL